MVAPWKVSQKGTHCSTAVISNTFMNEHGQMLIVGTLTSPTLNTEITSNWHSDRYNDHNFSRLVYVNVLIIYYAMGGMQHR